MCPQTQEGSLGGLQGYSVLAPATLEWVLLYPPEQRCLPPDPPAPDAET